MSKDKKALLIVSENPVISEALKDLMAAKERSEETRKFILKQVETAQNTYNTERAKFWKIAQDELLTLGKVSADKNPLSLKDGVIYLGEDENPLSSLLSAMFGRPFDT